MDHPKLVAPQPRDDVVLSHKGEHAFGDLAQQVVPGVVTKAVVYGLKTVQIEKK